MKKQPLIIGFVLAFLLPAFAFAAQVSVSLGNNSISPSTVDINPGDTVVWNNTSNSTQSVTADNGGFQSGAMNPGGQFAATFSQSGTYNYYDNASSGAVLGEVIVGGASVTTPTSYVNPNYSSQTETTSSNSAQAASLTSEVQQLIAEIDSLEGNSSAGVSTSGSSSGSVSGAPSYTAGGACPQIGRVLSYGASGSDVLSLQQFLGVTPATGFYGSITQSTVEQWQAANNIISYGTPATTGYGVVGPRTAAAIRLACSEGQTNSNNNTAPGTGTVSGYLQVTPISGSAPLAVTMVATVNVANSCTGSIYTVTFGDSSPSQEIPVAQGNCSQQNQTFQHTYEYGGTYIITLSSGAHESTATITVSGEAAPTTTTTTTTTASSTPTGSLTAPISSGTAPLATTFYVSCASGLAYDITFGDGTDLGSTNVSQTTCTGALQAVTHTYQSGGSYTAQLIIFSQNSSGTISSQAVASQTITVNGVPPSTTLSATPTSGSEPLAVSFSASNLTVGASYTINFGDGSSGQLNEVIPECPAGSSPCLPGGNASHTYTSPGSYTATLTDNCTGGCAIQASATVTVSGAVSSSYPPPTLTPYVGSNPLAISLAYSYDSSNCDVSINWGDTSSYSSPTCSNFTGQSQSFTQSHTYATTGNYTVTLVRNAQTDTSNISIKN